jgi:hypothetical protein
MLLLPFQGEPLGTLVASERHRNRFIRTPDGEEGLNCPLRRIQVVLHPHQEPMKKMAGLIRAGRYADEIMVPR